MAKGKVEENKFILRIDPLTPEKTFVFSFKGKNPLKITKIGRGLIADAYGIPGKKLFEAFFYISNSAEKQGFSAIWNGELNWDAYTILRVEIKTDGFQRHANGEGEFTMWIYPQLEITVPVSTALHRAAWFLYYHFFYKQILRKYAVKIDRYTQDLKRILAQQFGVTVKFG